MVTPMTDEERQRAKERAMANKEQRDEMTDYWEDDCPADIAEEIHKWLKEKSDE